MTEIIGYLNWRRNMRGGVFPEKILKEHVDGLQARNAWYYKEIYLVNLVSSHPLTGDQWTCSLTQLAQLFPYRSPVDAPQRGDQA